MATTKAVIEVLQALTDTKPLPYRGGYVGNRYKRHEKAILVLLHAGVIYKDAGHILQIKCRCDQQEG